MPKSTHPKWGMRTRLSWLCHEEDVQEGAGRAGGHHALEKVLVEEEGTPGLVPGSSCQRFIHRRRAFMKKLLTVLSSKPSCCEMVICISLDGRLFSLKMAIRVRRWRSVKTSRCFLGCRLLSFCCSCSLRLQAYGAERRPQGCDTEWVLQWRCAHSGPSRAVPAALRPRPSRAAAGWGQTSARSASRAQQIKSPSDER